MIRNPGHDYFRDMPLIECATCGKQMIANEETIVVHLDSGSPSCFFKEPCKMKFIPSGNRVLVKPEEAATKTPGGIILPDQAK